MRKRKLNGLLAGGLVFAVICGVFLAWVLVRAKRQLAHDCIAKRCLQNAKALMVSSEGYDAAAHELEKGLSACPSDGEARGELYRLRQSIEWEKRIKTPVSHDQEKIYICFMDHLYSGRYEEAKAIISMLDKASALYESATSILDNWEGVRLEKMPLLLTLSAKQKFLNDARTNSLSLKMLVFDAISRKDFESADRYIEQIPNTNDRRYCRGVYIYRKNKDK